MVNLARVAIGHLANAGTLRLAAERVPLRRV
jgi:hypothetical protein